MPATTVSAGRAAARPAGRTAGRKSPLRVVSELPPFTFDDDPGVDSAAAWAEMERARELTAAQLRRLMISEFRDWLRDPDQPERAAVPARNGLRLRGCGDRAGRLDDGRGYRGRLHRRATRGR